MTETVTLKTHNPEGVREVLERLEGLQEDNQMVVDLLFVAIAAACVQGFEETSIFSLVATHLEMVKEKLDD